VKFLYLTDTHFRANNPEHRIDDFHVALINKLRECLVIGREQGVECYVHGGDLFNGPYPSYSLIDEVVDIIEAEKKSFWVNIGNHDINGHNPETVSSCALGHISRRSRYIKIMPPIIKDFGGCVAHAVPYSHDVETYLMGDEFKTRIANFKDKPQIVFIHGMVISDDAPFQHITFKQLDCKEVTAYFLGHYHTPQITNNYMPKYSQFIAPGSIARLAALETNFERKVYYSIFDTTTRSASTLILKTAAPGSEVFAMDQVRETKAYQGRVADFLESLDNMKLASMNVLEILRQVATELGDSNDVVEEVIKRLEKKE
jgi:exonuclease SbcD